MHLNSYFILQVTKGETLTWYSDCFTLDIVVVYTDVTSLEQIDVYAEPTSWLVFTNAIIYSVSWTKYMYNTIKGLLDVKSQSSTMYDNCSSFNL